MKTSQAIEDQKTEAKLNSHMDAVRAQLFSAAKSYAAITPGPSSDEAADRLVEAARVYQKTEANVSRRFREIEKRRRERARAHHQARMKKATIAAVRKEVRRFGLELNNLSDAYELQAPEGFRLEPELHYRISYYGDNDATAKAEARLDVLEYLEHFDSIERCDCDVCAEYWAKKS